MASRQDGEHISTVRQHIDSLLLHTGHTLDFREASRQNRRYNVVQQSFSRHFAHYVFLTPLFRTLFRPVPSPQTLCDNQSTNHAAASNLEASSILFNSIGAVPSKKWRLLPEVFSARRWRASRGAASRLEFRPAEDYIENLWGQGNDGMALIKKYC